MCVRPPMIRVTHRTGSKHRLIRCCVRNSTHRQRPKSCLYEYVQIFKIFLKLQEITIWLLSLQFLEPGVIFHPKSSPVGRDYP